MRGVKVAGVLGNENLFVHMNFKTPPFDNPKVRQAIVKSVDNAAVKALVYPDGGDVAETVRLIGAVTAGQISAADHRAQESGVVLRIAA